MLLACRPIAQQGRRPSSAARTCTHQARWHALKASLLHCWQASRGTRAMVSPRPSRDHFADVGKMVGERAASDFCSRRLTTAGQIRNVAGTPRSPQRTRRSSRRTFSARRKTVGRRACTHRERVPLALPVPSTKKGARTGKVRGTRAAHCDIRRCQTTVGTLPNQHDGLLPHRMAPQKVTISNPLASTARSQSHCALVMSPK
mgnify:CR=1 FL=1